MCGKLIKDGAIYLETIPGTPKAECYACVCEAYQVLDQFVQEVDDGT